MNLKSKNGKKVLRNASLIGAGMFILGAGIGVGTSGNTSSSVQKPRVQKQGVVESSTENKSSSVSTSDVSSKRDTSSKLAESASSKLDTSSSIAFSKNSSSSSSSSETHTDSNSNSNTQQENSSSTSMPQTAAVSKTYTVVRGDSLWSISQLLHKNFAELLIKNPSANPDHIEAGEVINL